MNEEKLKDEGWEEPLKESLVEVPNGWYGGQLEHTGGGVYNRVWINQPERPTNEDSDVEKYLKVSYGFRFGGVKLVKYELDDDGNFDSDGIADKITVSQDKQTDSACAEAAVKLMQKFH